MRREPVVSDHALVRFLQRSGLDVEQVRADLARGLARAHGAARELGSRDHVVSADGLSFLIRESVVVTVVHDAGPHVAARLLDRSWRP